jgi:uncharacterized membrane protein YbaN (DUF454 family)
MAVRPGASHGARAPRIRKGALLALGWLCVGLGFVGILLPGVPTTIFLIVAAWCFIRSSERAHAWLLQHRILGPYVRDFLSGKGMPLSSKVVALTMMWLACGTSAWLFVNSTWGKAVVLTCAAIGTVAVLRVPTRIAGKAPDAVDPGEGLEPRTSEDGEST